MKFPDKIIIKDHPIVPRINIGHFFDLVKESEDFNSAQYRFSRTGLVTWIALIEITEMKNYVELIYKSKKIINTPLEKEIDELESMGYR